MSGGGNPNTGNSMQPPSWGGPMPSVNPWQTPQSGFQGDYSQQNFQQGNYFQPQQNFMPFYGMQYSNFSTPYNSYVGGSDNNSYDRTVGYQDFPYKSIPSTGYTGPMGGDSIQKQPVQSSGPTSPIVSRSASMRRPYVLNYAGGGIASL